MCRSVTDVIGDTRILNVAEVGEPKKRSDR